MSSFTLVDFFLQKNGISDSIQEFVAKTRIGANSVGGKLEKQYLGGCIQKTNIKIVFRLNMKIIKAKNWHTNKKFIA